MKYLKEVAKPDIQSEIGRAKAEIAVLKRKLSVHLDPKKLAQQMNEHNIDTETENSGGERGDRKTLPKALAQLFAGR